MTGHEPWSSLPFPFAGRRDYRVYESAKQVLSEYFGHPQLVVERFLPEREGDLYFARSYHFVGDITPLSASARSSRSCSGTRASPVEEIEPHSEVIGRRRASSVWTTERSTMSSTTGRW